MAPVPPHNLRDRSGLHSFCRDGMRLLGIVLLALVCSPPEGLAQGARPSRAFFVHPADPPEIPRWAETGRALRAEIYGRWGGTGRRERECRLPSGHVLPSCTRHMIPGDPRRSDATLALDVGVVVIEPIVAADSNRPYFAWLPIPQTTNGPGVLLRLNQLAVAGDTLRCTATACVRPAFSVHGADTVVNLCESVRVRSVIGPPETCRPIGTWGPQGSFALALVGWGKPDVAARVNATAPSTLFAASPVREVELRVQYSTDAQRARILGELERALSAAPWTLTTELRPPTPPHSRVLGLVAFRHSPVLRSKWEIVKVEMELDNPSPSAEGRVARLLVSIDARNSRQNVADASGFVSASDADYALYESALIRAITEHLAPHCARGADARTLHCTS